MYVNCPKTAFSARALNRFNLSNYNILLWSFADQELPAAKLFLHMSERHLWTKAMHDNTFNTDFRTPPRLTQIRLFGTAGFPKQLHRLRIRFACFIETFKRVIQRYAPRADMITLAWYGGWYLNNHVLTSQHTLLQNYHLYIPELFDGFCVVCAFDTEMKHPVKFPL